MCGEYGYGGVNPTALINCPAEFGGGPDGPICWFTKDMRKLCGAQVHITETLWLKDYSLYAYHISEYDSNKYFTETMFELEGKGAQDLPEISDEDLEAYMSE